MRYLVVLLVVLVGCGGGGDEAVGPHVAEQTDYFDGVVWHRYFRYESGKIGYATSLDGVEFERYVGNPVMEGLFPVLVKGDDVYLLVKQGNDYNLYETSVKTKPCFVRTVLSGGYFNIGVTVVDGRWHALVEGKSGEVFHLRYTWSDWPVDFGEHMGPVVFGDAGNAYLTHVPERGVLALFGGGYSATGKWLVKSATFDFSEWRMAGFQIIGPSHMADPDMGVEWTGFLTVGSGQDSVDTYRFVGSKVEFFDAVVSGHVELESLGTTMRP